MLKRFSYLTLIVSAISMLLIYFLSLIGWVSIENEPVFRKSLLGIYLLAVSALILKEFFSDISRFSDIIEKNILVMLAFAALLIASIFHKKVGINFTGVFILFVIIHFAFNRKIYKLNNVYFYLFFYALFLLVGTIGSSKGLHFPELTYTFYLLPLSLMFFKPTQNNLISVAKVVFKALLLYMAISIIYWWYNYLHLDVDFFSWISKKLFIEAGMIDWDYQRYFTKNAPTFQAFLFINSWTYYFHPSYISLVLLFGLIIAFYLFYKRETTANSVNTFDIIIYNLFIILVVALMESRVGMVGYVFTIVASSLYYSKLKLHQFKITIAVYLVLGISLIFILDNTIDGFLGDNIRGTDYKLALSYIKEHIFWGVGYGDQHIALMQQEELLKDVLPSALNEKTYTHNQFLGNLLQFGIWGLIALVIMLGGFIHYAIKNRSYLLQMFLSIVLLFMLIEEPLYTQEGITRFTVFLVFFVAISELKQDKKELISF